MTNLREGELRLKARYPHLSNSEIARLSPIFKGGAPAKRRRQMQELRDVQYRLGVQGSGRMEQYIAAGLPYTMRRKRRQFSTEAVDRFLVEHPETHYITYGNLQYLEYFRARRNIG